MQENAKSFSSRISWFCTFFFSLLNFVCDFFGLLKHIPIILRSHSKFPMPQQHCAAGESPEELLLGGCRLPQQWCRAGGGSRLLFPLLLTWAANRSGRAISFPLFSLQLLGAFPSITKGFLPLSRDDLYSRASHFSCILKHGKRWRLGRAQEKGSGYLGSIQNGIRLKAGFESVTFLFSPEPLRGWK